MDGLIKEWTALRESDYKLKFRYPTPEQKQVLRLINREPVRPRKTKRKKLEVQQELLLQAVERGEVDADQLISELQKRRGRSQE